MGRVYFNLFALLLFAQLSFLSVYAEESLTPSTEPMPQVSTEPPSFPEVPSEVSQSTEDTLPPAEQSTTSQAENNNLPESVVESSAPAEPPPVSPPVEVKRSIRIRTFGVETLRPSLSGRMYIFYVSKRTPVPILNKIIVIKREERLELKNVMAFRVVKTYPDLRQFVAKKIRSYLPPTERLEAGSKYTAIEKIGEKEERIYSELPVNASPKPVTQQSTNPLEDSAQNLGEDPPTNPTPEPELAPFSQAQDLDALDLKDIQEMEKPPEDKVPELKEDADMPLTLETLPDQSPELNDNSAQEAERLGQNQVPDLNEAPIQTDLGDNPPPILESLPEQFDENAPEPGSAQEQTYSENNPEPVDGEPQPDPTTESGSSSDSASPSSEETEVVPPVKERIPLLPSYRDPPDLEITQRDSNDGIMRRNYYPRSLEVGYGLIRGIPVLGGKSFQMGNQFGIGYDFFCGIFLCGSERDRLSLEFALYYFRVRTEEDGIQKLFTMMPYQIRGRYGFHISEKTELQFYGGFLYSFVVSFSNATPEDLNKARRVIPIFGTSIEHQVGPQWFLRGNFGLDAVSASVVIRF